MSRLLDLEERVRLSEITTRMHQITRQVGSSDTADLEALHGEGDELVSEALRICGLDELAGTYSDACGYWWYA